MAEMERGSISGLALEGLKRGMSYGQYVAAAYYPVTVEIPLEEGVKTVCPHLPPVLDGWEELVQRHRSRAVDGPCRCRKTRKEPGERTGEQAQLKERPVRRCAVCGGVLPPDRMRYCTEECKGEGVKKRYLEKLDRLKAERAAQREANPKPELECVVCGGSFRSTMPHAKYCSEACRRTGAARVMHDYRVAQLAARPQVERHCSVCGVELTGAARKYCPECAAEENRQRWRRRNRQGG